MTVTLRELDGDPNDMAALQRVLEGAPEYTQRVTGHPVGPADAQSLFSALPPGLVYDAKHVLAVEHDGAMVGVVDLLDGWPDPRTAHIGLLLLDEPHQRLGLGGARSGIKSKFCSVLGRTYARCGPPWSKPTSRCCRSGSGAAFATRGSASPYTYDKLVSSAIILDRPVGQVHI